MFKYLNDKLASLYIRYVLHMAPNAEPDSREEYHPDYNLNSRDLPNVVTRYASRMKDVYSSTHSFKTPSDSKATKEEYEMRNLRVMAVTHMKERDLVAHEYLVLHVVVPPRNTRFYLRLERTWKGAAAGKHVPDFVWDMVDSTLSKDANKSAADEQRVAIRKARARWQEMKANIEKAGEKGNNRTSSGRALETSLMSSSIAVGGDVYDHVSLTDVDASLDSDKAYVIEHVVFHTKFPFIYAISLAATVSHRFAYYVMFNHQCYFFAATILQCLKKYAEEGASVVRTTNVRRPEFIDIDIGQDAASTKSRLPGWVADKSTNKKKAGTFLRIPIYLYKESVFKALWEDGWLGKSGFKKEIDVIVKAAEDKAMHSRQVQEAREAAEKRAEEERKRADEERKAREAAEQRADEERKAREAAERKAEEKANEERKAREAAERKAEEAERRMEAMLARMQAEGLSIDI